MNTFKYISYKDNHVISQGEMLTMFMTLLIHETFDKHIIDQVKIIFDNGKEIIIDSDSVLFDEVPNNISIEEHNQWFYKDNPHVNR